MKINKISHCCLVVDESDLTIITDPGMYGSGQNQVRGIDVVLITHEHRDHFHVDSVKAILKNNPKACVITNSSVGKLLAKEGINFVTIENGQGMTYKDVSIEGHGTKHEPIYDGIPSVLNTGYFIGDKLFYPGDAFYDPGKYVEVLALPVAGPWMKISEALDYAKSLKPKNCFPVHDGMIRTDMAANFAQNLANKVLGPLGINFIPMGENSTAEFS
jgi:L-ascorbate metabolism protein UlaG (beta-lactamase superfamily)